MKIMKNFTVFEGADGSGTSTQLRLLEDRFEKAGERPLPPLFTTSEPTDGPVGRLLRSGLKGETPLKSETIAYLFAADRNEHLFGPEGIAERCQRGELVVQDRYTASSLVYQGITCGDELPARLNRDFPVPELLFYFDIDSETAQKRMAERKTREIYEHLEFQIKVRERYKALLNSFEEAGSRLVVIDASLPPQEVADEVWREIQKLPIF
ncbi:MAG: dTMP kinase [Treponema sp.]|jgi:dTMP kinase|nr:dTMP kinase [Treponema sp.]